MNERLYDPPHMEHEVVRMRHESAECGRIVGVRSTEQSGYQGQKSLLRDEIKNIGYSDKS